MSNSEISTSMAMKQIIKAKNLGDVMEVEHLELKPINEYLQNLCQDKNMKKIDVINNADIERGFGHQLFNGRRTPSRDTTICLAFGLHLNVKETQRLLIMAGKRTLYPKIKRDAVIIYALENGYTIRDVEMALYDLKLPVLAKNGEKVVKSNIKG